MVRQGDLPARGRSGRYAAVGSMRDRGAHARDGAGLAADSGGWCGSSADRWTGRVVMSHPPLPHPRRVRVKYPPCDDRYTIRYYAQERHRIHTGLLVTRRRLSG
ncbi:hypothetical protein GCM10010195_33520 [Kitasatospora griseola]|nr:hypothetical protein GCM10010195_33520 [Kitasatospora griseola]